MYRTMPQHVRQTPNTRQAPKCQADIQMSGKHPNVRQAPQCQASTQMSGRHPNVRQAPNTRQTPDVRQCPRYATMLQICHNAPKYVAMPQYLTMPRYATLPRYVTMPQYATMPQRGPGGPGRALGSPGGALGMPRGPGGPRALGALAPPLCSPYFPSMLLRCGEHLRCILHWCKDLLPMGDSRHSSGVSQTPATAKSPSHFHRLRVGC